MYAVQYKVFVYLAPLSLYLAEQGTDVVESPAQGPKEIGDIDTDDEKDEEAEYEQWKSRELRRIRRAGWLLRAAPLPARRSAREIPPGLACDLRRVRAHVATFSPQP